VNLTYWVKEIKFDLIFFKKNMTLASGSGHDLIFVCLFVSQGPIWLLEKSFFLESEFWGK